MLCNQMPAFPAENLFLLIQFCRFMDASYTLSTVLLMQFGSVQVYGGSARMELLHDLFPHMVDKHSLATADELRPFEGKASLLAAVDYHVSLHSNIFFSASRGNMHNNLAGHRAYLNVRKTIKPDMILLSNLFSNKSLDWPEFRNQTIEGHINRLGQIRPRQPGQSIYTYPAPDCMCKHSHPEV
jgi:hypothetical protein